MVIGDGRLTLADQPGRFDLIVVDAFSSDAIPVHLLTEQAFATYLGKLAPDGALVLHITNRNMDLQPVVAASAAAHGLTGGVREAVVEGSVRETLAGTARVTMVAAGRSIWDRSRRIRAGSRWPFRRASAPGPTTIPTSSGRS